MKGESDRHVVRALRSLAGGNVLAGLAAWRRAGRVEGELGRVAARILAVAEGRGERNRAAPVAREIGPRNAEWGMLWAGDTAGAKKLAEKRPDDPAAWGALGVVDVLEGRAAAGLGLLERALAGGADAELVLHRVHALLQLGRDSEARAKLEGLGNGESLGRRVLVALEKARNVTLSVPAPERGAFRRDCELLAASETHLNGLFSTTLPAIVGRPALEHAFESPAALARLLDGLLDRMAGNLGLSPTLAEVTPSGERRYVRLALEPTTRHASAEALRSLAYVGVGGVFSALDAVLVRHPRSVYPRCYRGELYLWLGRYHDAWREFDAAERLEPARWADIGKLASLIMTDRASEAHALAVATEARWPPIVGGTLPVYRGVLRRRTGDLEGAIRDLRGALDAKPSRIGARVELCLALRATGAREEAAGHTAQILKELAPMLVDVADGRGVDWVAEPTVLLEDAVLEGALGAMRGNRSSSVVTWIDAAGEVRVLESGGGAGERAAEVLRGLGLG